MDTSKPSRQVSCMINSAIGNKWRSSREVALVRIPAMGLESFSGSNHLKRETLVKVVMQLKGGFLRMTPDKSRGPGAELLP